MKDREELRAIVGGEGKDVGRHTTVTKNQLIEIEEKSSKFRQGCGMTVVCFQPYQARHC